MNLKFFMFDSSKTEYRCDEWHNYLASFALWLKLG
jgi:hypothetical protein